MISLIEQVKKVREDMAEQTSAKVRKQQHTTPVKIRGVITSWYSEVECRLASEYRLVTVSGAEYLILSDPVWRETLSKFVWKNVRLKGELNILGRSIVPIEIESDHPDEEKSEISLVLNKVLNLGQLRDHFQFVPKGA